MKIIALYVAPLVLFAIAWFFYRLAKARVPSAAVAGLRIFTAGFLVGIAGLSVAVFFGRVDDGAAIVFFGFVISACGLIKFFKDRADDHSQS